ncbi:NAD-dependent epimerase/dehydratase family protein [Rhizobium leguminosarum]|uniref:NAD-dependent epimerase/dehydratase family protein n=1 Tax=Rhizobium leguminosarum TaxID=384 RepID=UPI0013EEA90C|nr:NAD(P)-dependent oxidoreductase [Rhizobium leguminosarum]
MKVLLVGGSSALAHAIRKPLSASAEVITAGRTECDIRLDIADISGAELPSGIDAVINTAAAFAGSSVADLEQAAKANVLGPVSLMRLCEAAEVQQLVHISSIFAELATTSPFFGAYALSKRQAEEWLELAAVSSSVKVTVLRPSQFYGTGVFNRRHQPFLSTIIDRARKGEDIAIYGNNDALRNFIHVDDVAEVIVRSVRKQVAGTYRCVSQANLRYSDIAKAAIEAFSSRSIIRFLSDKPDIADNAFPPDETLYRLIDYFPQISFKRGMQMEAAATDGAAA